MLQRVPALLSVSFTTNIQRRVQLSIESGISFDGSRLFRGYPSESPHPQDPSIFLHSMTATRGVVSPKNTGIGLEPQEQVVVGESVKFDNTNQAQTRLAYPRGLFFDTTRSRIILTGNTTQAGQVGFVYDLSVDAIRAVEPLSGRDLTVSGILVVDYVAPYGLYSYLPEVNTFNINGSGFFGSTVFFGSVYAFNGDASTSIEFDPPTQGDSDYREYYRVYSKVVADNTFLVDSIWENPPNWPIQGGGTGTLPEPNYGFPTEGPDPDVHFFDDRIHERGFISRSGTLDTKFNATELYRPYFGSATFRPRYLFKRQQSPPDPVYEDAWAGIRWDQVVAAVGNRYPGYTEA